MCLTWEPAFRFVGLAIKSTNQNQNKTSASKKWAKVNLNRKVQIRPVHLPNHHSKEQHGKELKNGQVNIINSASSFTRIPNTEPPWLLIIIGHFESFFSLSKALWIKIEKVIFLIRYSDLGIVRESETVN